MEQDTVTFDEFLEHLMSDDAKKLESLSQTKTVKIDKNIILCCDRLRKVSSTLDSIRAGLKYVQTHQFSSDARLNKVIETLKSLHEEVDKIQSTLVTTFKFNNTQ